MRWLFVAMLCMAAGVAVLRAEEPKGVRNPFWPDGYEGVREIISPEAHEQPAPPPTDAEAERLKAEAERQAAEEARKAAEDALAKAKAVAPPPAPKAPPTSADDAWTKARKALRIGNPASVTDAAGRVRTSVNINGDIYVDGDLVSVTVEGICYTWRLRGVEGSKSIKLVRVRAVAESDLKKGAKRK